MNGINGSNSKIDYGTLKYIKDTKDEIYRHIGDKLDIISQRLEDGQQNFAKITEQLNIAEKQRKTNEESIKHIGNHSIGNFLFRSKKRIIAAIALFLIYPNATEMLHNHPEAVKSFINLILGIM